PLEAHLPPPGLRHGGPATGQRLHHHGQEHLGRRPGGGGRADLPLGQDRSRRSTTVHCLWRGRPLAPRPGAGHRPARFRSRPEGGVQPMSTTSLFDPAGPRAKRRHLFLEIITALVVLAGAYVVFKLLYDKGELSAAAWAPFAEPGLWALLGQGLWNNIAAALVGMVLSLITGCLLA